MLLAHFVISSFVYSLKHCPKAFNPIDMRHIIHILANRMLYKLMLIII